jgi:hypothetical protein
VNDKTLETFVTVEFTQDRPIFITQESDISMELDGARATSSWFVIQLYILRLYDIA